MTEDLTPVFKEETDILQVTGLTPPDKMKLFIEVERRKEEQAEQEKQAATAETEDGGEAADQQAEQQNLPAKIEQEAKKEPRRLERIKIDSKYLFKMLEKHVNLDDVNAGVIEDIVRLLNEGNEEIKRRRIAAGKPPVDGEDGKLLLLKKAFSGEVDVQIDAEGFADFFSLHLFDNVASGDIVARIYPPKPGEDGIDVFRKTVKAKAGKPYNIRLDETLELRPPPKGKKFEIIVARDEGYLVQEQNRLTMKTDLVIRGDIDFHYGSLDFIGKIQIQGDVLPGFNIKAKKGIEIDGSVKEANLICTEGDIVVKGYIYGGKRAKVVCAHNFFASIAHEVNAEIVGDIVVQKEARDSALRTQAGVFVKEGTLVGGQTYVVAGAEAKIAGGIAESVTEINVCSSVEATEEYTRLVADITNHGKVIELLKMHLGPYAKNPDRIQLLDEPFRKKMEKFRHKWGEVERSKAALLKKKKEMLDQSQSGVEPRVNIIELLHPGVIVRVNENQFESKEEMKGPFTLQYNTEEEKIIVSEYKELKSSVAAQAG